MLRNIAMAREVALRMSRPRHDVPIVSVRVADPEPCGGCPRPLTLVVVSWAGDAPADHARTRRESVYSPEMQSGMMQYPSQDGTPINAYVSRPGAAGCYPGVIVSMEAFGLVDHIKDVAQRFAEQGYLALVPDMYTREGSPDPSHLDRVLHTMFSVPDMQAVADLEAALASLKRRPGSHGKVGAIGFCSGGRYTRILACQSTNLHAAVNPPVVLSSRTSRRRNVRCRRLP